MLIEDAIERACTEGQLFQVKSMDWRAPTERLLYATPEVYRFLEEESTSPQINDNRRRLRALFEKFISGATLTITFRQSVQGTEMKRLQPDKCEVWEFKIQKRRTRLRVFARFASPESVVALTGPVDKAGIDYNAETIRCQIKWQQTFGDHVPLHGDKYNVYFARTKVLCI